MTNTSFPINKKGNSLVTHVGDTGMHRYNYNGVTKLLIDMNIEELFCIKTLLAVKWPSVTKAKSLVGYINKTINHKTAISLQDIKVPKLVEGEIHKKDLYLHINMAFNDCPCHTRNLKIKEPKLAEYVLQLVEESDDPFAFRLELDETNILEIQLKQPETDYVYAKLQKIKTGYVVLKRVNTIKWQHEKFPTVIEAINSIAATYW